MEIATVLQPDDLTELDQVCRLQHISRADAVHEALRYYIERKGELPTIDYCEESDLD